MGMGRNLLSLQHLLHTPNLLQLPLKTTHHAAHSGMRIPYQCRWDKNSVSSPPLEPCFDVPNNSPNHLLNSLFLWLEKLAKKSSNQTTHLFSCQNSL